VVATYIMATPILHRQQEEECYSDEEDDDFFGMQDTNAHPAASSNLQGLEGWQLAARGVQMAINNRVEEGQELLKVDSSCIHRQAGLCYLSFINALMTFEEDKMAKSLTTLRAMEKRCSSNLSWSPSFSSFQSMKSRLWGAQAGLSHQQTQNAKVRSAALKLEQQIILADCQVLAAILNFINQDWGSYMKGAWVLRRAWKIYQRTYTDIRRHYIKRIGLGGNSIAPPPPSHQMRGGPAVGSAQNRSSSSVANSTSPSTSSSSSSNNGSPIKEIPSIGSTCNNRVSHSVSVPLNLFNVMHKQADLNNPAGGSPAGDQGTLPNNKSDMDAASLIPPVTIRRLMAAVSFGYGLFHLAVSLLPPKLLNVIHFLGFEGDRQTGIQALHFARQGNDMRGPLATLALLWFHTIVRPFFGLDGSNVRSGADAAQRLIDASKGDFSEAALFLFFQGRVDRLKSNFSGALVSYEKALSMSAQREVRLLCLHEVGWSYVLLLHWEKSSMAFLQLKNESRWSKSFYCYLSAVCLGAFGDIAKCLELAEETPKLSRRSGHQLERFLLRRAHQMIDDCNVLDQDYCLLLAYELLYLWNALGACLKHSHAAIQIDCEKIYVGNLEGVRQLILGSVYSNAGKLDVAKQCYIKAMKAGEATDDTHTSAFAAYELGMSLCRNPETRGEGCLYLERARDNYQNYDFESRLTVRIHSALRYYSLINEDKIN